MNKSCSSNIIESLQDSLKEFTPYARMRAALIERTKSLVFAIYCSYETDA